MNCALRIVHYELWRHPLSIQAVGNCHPGLDPGTRRIHPQTANVAAYNWFPCQARDDVMCERLNWKRTYSLFIAHYSLCIMHCALWIVHCSLCIVHYALCIVHYALCIMHYALCIMNCPLYNVRACVCVWGVLNHLNPFYGENRRLTVKNRRFTVITHRFSTRKPSVFNA